jgi:hypothetical protein
MDQVFSQAQETRLSAWLRGGDKLHNLLERFFGQHLFVTGAVTRQVDARMNTILFYRHDLIHIDIDIMVFTLSDFDECHSSNPSFQFHRFRDSFEITHARRFDADLSMVRPVKPTVPQVNHLMKLNDILGKRSKIRRGAPAERPFFHDLDINAAHGPMRG